VSAPVAPPVLAPVAAATPPPVTPPVADPVVPVLSDPTNQTPLPEGVPPTSGSAAFGYLVAVSGPGLMMLALVL